MAGQNQARISRTGGRAQCTSHKNETTKLDTGTTANDLQDHNAQQDDSSEL